MARILVVDDSTFVRMTNVRLLKELGYETLEAATGVEAVEVYQKARPDVVLMDITMPVMDGLEALNEIVAIDENAKVVMATAMGQQKIVIQAIKAGARDFVVKPLDRARLGQVLDKLVG